MDTIPESTVKKGPEEFLSSPIKVLHLISSRGLYGAERAVVNLTAAADCCQVIHQVALLRTREYPNTEFIDAIREKQGTAHVVPCRKWIDPEALQRVKQLIVEEGIDIVHCHEMKGRLYGLLATMRTSARPVTTNHNWIRSHFLVTCFESVDAFYIRFFPKIIAVSEEVRALMRRYLVPSDQIQVIINGIDIHEFNQDKIVREDIRNEFGIDRNTRLIGSVGRISPEKGHRYFIEAAAQVLRIYPNTCFLIVGEGFQSGAMKDYAVRLGLSDKVIFAGFRSNIAKIYSSLDIFVLPSLLEGTPMALLEAMSAKLPVIATDVGGVGQIIHNGENGLLVPAADAEGLGAAIIRLLGNSMHAEDMAKNALRIVAERYSVKKMANSYMKLYMALVQKR